MTSTIRQSLCKQVIFKATTRISADDYINVSTLPAPVPIGIFITPIQINGVAAYQIRFTGPFDTNPLSGFTFFVFSSFQG